MRTYLHFSLLILLSIIGSSKTSAQGISMSPTRLFFSGNPGETVSLPVILSNGSNTDYVFNVNTKDWKREQDGNKIYFESSTLKNSNASWVSTVESSVSLPAKTDKEIMVSMKIPANGTSIDVTNSMLFFTQIGKQKDTADTKNGIGIITLFEFGLHIYYTPHNNTKLSLDIISIKDVTGENSTSRNVAVGIQNDGNVVNDATVVLELTNTATGEELKLDPINISMIPGSEQVVNFHLPMELSGTYLGVSIVKMAGTNDLRVGEKTFTF